MRIISKFHDYYDSALKQGIDSSIVYVRDQKEELISKYDYSYYPFVRNSLPFRTKYQLDKELQNDFCYLGYCGKIIPILILSVSPKQDFSILAQRHSKVCYSFEEVERFCLENNITLSQSRGWRRNSSYFDLYPSSIKDFFNQTDFKLLPSIFSQKNVPLFFYQERTHGEYVLTLNPSLKNLEFFRQKDPFTCFQDIAQFVSGVLNSKENEMVKISDKDKVHKHGFDKWSFRTKGPNSK